MPFVPFSEEEIAQQKRKQKPKVYEAARFVPFTDAEIAARSKTYTYRGNAEPVEGVTGSAAVRPTSGGRTGATSSGTAVSVASSATPLKTAAKEESEGGLLPSSFRTGPITSKTEVDRFVQNLQAERAAGLSDTDVLNAAVDHVYRLYGVDTQGERSLNVLPAAGSQLLEDIVDRLGLSEAARSQAGIGSPYYGGVNSTGKGDYPFIRPWDERTTSEESRAFQQQERAEEFVGDVTPGKAALLGVGSGMNRVSTGLEQLKNILQGDLDPVQKNSMEYIGDVVNEKGSGLEKGLFSLTDNITAMAPSMLAGGPAGVMLTGLTSGANSYRGSRLEGYDAGESLLYGVVNGALESALQYALGGLKGLGKGGFSKALAKTPLKDTLSRATAKVIKSVPMQNFLKSAASYGGSMLDEGFEEYVQALLDPVVRNVILNEQNSFEPFSEDKLYAAMMGALTAGLMNAPSNLAQYTQNRRAGNRILQNGETDIALNQAAEIADPDTQLSRNIEYLRGRQEGGKSVSPALLGKTMGSASALAVEKSTPAYAARSTGQALGIDENIIKTAEKLAENTGRRIEFVETLGEGRNGKYDAATGTLYVAANSPNPILTILKHELTHSIEGTKAYEELSSYILDTIVSESGISLDDIVRAKIRQYAQRGETLDTQGAIAELVADYVGDNLFTSEAAIRRLSAEKPGVARRILNWIRSLKTKLAGTAEEKALARLEKLYHEALMEPFSKGGGVRYSFAGTTAKTADIKALSQARKMQNEGADPETIRKETGWFQGYDGKWRFEIDDSKAVFRKDGDARLMQDAKYQRLVELTEKFGEGDLSEAEILEMDRLQDEFREQVWAEKYLLSDFLEHTELYDAYPELKYTSLVFDELPGGEKGYYQPRSNTIVLSNALFGKDKDTLMHEIQHILQRYEGFAKGSSPGYWNGKIEEGYSKRDKNGMDLYRATAGEIEARDVTARMNLTPEQRKNTRPDIDRTDVVFAEDGAQYSVEKMPDGRQYVKADRDVIHGENPDEWRKQVQNYINDSIRHGKDVVVYGADGDALTITRDTAGKARFRNEITLPDGSKRPMTDREFAVKLRAESHIDELAQASTRGKYDVPDTKNHPFAKDGFNYRTAYFLDNDGSYYRLTLSVGKNGEVNTVYNVGKIKEAKLPLVAQRPTRMNARPGRLASSPSVSQNTDGVNTSISETAPDDTQSSLGVSSGDTIADIKAMVEKYGAIKPGEAPARDVQIPRQTNDGTRVRQFVRTAAEAAQVPDSFVGGITQDVMDEVYNYVPISNQEAMNRAVNTVEKLGIDKALEQWEAAANGAKGVNKYDMALGEYLLTLAGKNNDPALASKLIVELSTLGTEAGQAVQAMSMLKRMTPEGKLMALQRIADRLSRESKGEAVKIPEIIIDRMQRVNPTDTETADRIFHDGLVSLAEQVPPTLLDKWNAWRYLAMLGNPRTHIRNIVGNAVFTPVVGIKNTLAGAIEGAMDAASRAAGGKGIARTKTALAALPFTKRREYLDFARQSYRKNKEKLDSGSRLNPADIVRDNRPVFTSKLGKPVEAARKANSRAMQAEDGWFKRLHYERALMQYLAANKIDLSKLDAQTQNRAENYAMREAQKATFADDSAFANFLSRAARSNKGAGLLIEGIAPFKKTPVNIAKRAIEYSPAGLLDTVTRGAYRLKKGDISAAEFIDGLASGLTGTGIVALGMWLASKGLLTGGLGYDDEDGLARLQGAQEYALNLDDTSYTLDWAAPAALPLFVGAEIYNLFRESEKGEVPLPKMLEALTNLSEPMVNMSMLQGINDAIENVKYSDSELTDLMLNTLVGYAGQGVPTLFGQIARTMDDTRRRNYVEQGSAFPRLQTELQRNKSKIPGALQTQPPYVDAWGREEPSGSLAQRVFDNFISPGYTSRLQDSAMEEELRRLYGQTGEGGVLPSAAGKSLTYQGEKYALSAEEYTQYQRTAGRTAYDMLESLTGSSAYRSLSEEQKVKAVGELYDYAADLAKEEMLQGRGVEYTPSSAREKLDAAKRNGIAVPMYLLFQVKVGELKADKKPNGDPIQGSKKRKVEALIREMGVTGNQRQVLLALEGYGSEAQRERILSGESGGSGSGYGYLETDIDKLLKGALS